MNFDPLNDVINQSCWRRKLITSRCVLQFLDVEDKHEMGKLFGWKERAIHHSYRHTALIRSLVLEMVGVVERQACDLIRGGDLYSPTAQQKKALQATPVSNNAAESALAIFDQLKRKGPNSKYCQLEGVAMTIKNDFSSFLLRQTADTRNKIINESRSTRRSVVAADRQHEQNIQQQVDDKLAAQRQKNEIIMKKKQTDLTAEIAESSDVLQAIVNSLDSKKSQIVYLRQQSRALQAQYEVKINEYLKRGKKSHQTVEELTAAVSDAIDALNHVLL
jgi:hypothetical protein